MLARRLRLVTVAVYNVNAYVLLVQCVVGGLEDQLALQLVFLQGLRPFW